MWLKHMVESVSNNSLMVVEQRVKQRQCVHKCSFDLIHTEGTVIRDNDCIMVAPVFSNSCSGPVRPSCANLHYTELMAIREQIFSACVTLHEGGS